MIGLAAQTGLTQRQMDCLRYVQGFIAAKGYSPAYWEIADGLGVISKANIFRLVNGLVERGYFERGPESQRNLIVTSPVSIPRIGKTPLQFIPIGQQ